jgi:DNA repair protein RecO (recombination protein O)
MLCPINGRVTLVAKSAAASTKRFGGRIEPTTVIEALVYPKAGMWTLSDCSVVHAFPSIRTDFNRISLALYFIALSKKITVDHQPHPELYALLLESLHLLNLPTEPIFQVQTHFESQLIEIEGITPVGYHSGNFAHCFAQYTGQLIQPPLLLTQ